MFAALLDPVDAAPVNVDEEEFKYTFEYENELKGFFTYVNRHYRQNSLLRKGLMDLPRTKNDVKDDNIYGISQVEVFKKTHIIFRTKKNTFLPKIMEEITDGDSNAEINEEDLKTLFIDAIHVWDKYYALKELKERWVDHVRPGQGQQEHKRNFESYFMENHQGYLRGIEVSIMKLVHEIMKKFDRDLSGTISSIECCQNLTVMLESLIEWYNNSIYKQAEAELGEIIPYKYHAPKMKKVWLEACQESNNDAAREKILAHFWKNTLLDIRQVQFAKDGMQYFFKSPKDDYKEYPAEVTKAIVEAQFRHRGGPNLKYIWQAYRGEHETKINGKDIKRIIEESTETWIKVAPRTVMRKWADIYDKAEIDQVTFLESYTQATEQDIENWDIEGFIKPLIGGECTEDIIVEKKQFIELFQKSFVPFIMDCHLKARNHAEHACKPKNDDKESDSKEGKA